MEGILIIVALVVLAFVCMKFITHTDSKKVDSLPVPSPPPSQPKADAEYIYDIVNFICKVVSKFEPPGWDSTNINPIYGTSEMEELILNVIPDYQERTGKEINSSDSILKNKLKGIACLQWAEKQSEFNADWKDVLGALLKSLACNPEPSTLVLIAMLFEKNGYPTESVNAMMIANKKNNMLKYVNSSTLPDKEMEKILKKSCPELHRELQKIAEGPSDEEWDVIHKNNNKEYFVSINGGTASGPYALFKIRVMLAKHEISENDLIWLENKEKWLAIGDHLKTLKLY